MRSWARVVAVAALAMVAAAGVANAGPSGGGGHGGGGGGHFGGGVHGGGFHGGPGGWRGGYGWHGGYGWRGYGYGCCGWGWGWGLGLYLPLLPWYYDTYWWNGIPYYYADGNYYLWNGGVGEYEAVEPPAGVSEAPPQGSSVNPAVSSELFAYPKGGQSEAQQKKDKEECRHWATSETSFDPAAPAAGKEPGDARQNYLRAEAACLEARNYTVR